MNLLFWVMFWMASLAPGRSHIENATAIATVVLSEPPLFTDDESRVKTASLMVSTAFRESSFRNGAVGDHGHALCMYQLWNTSRDVLTDPELCTRIAMQRLRESMRVCGPGNELGLYAHGPGGCESARARRISLDRMALSKRIAAAASQEATP